MFNNAEMWADQVGNYVENSPLYKNRNFGNYIRGARSLGLIHRLL